MGDGTPRGYDCGNCHEHFDYEDDWTDADVLAEAEANGFDLADELVVICDDCYLAMGLG